MKHEDIKVGQTIRVTQRYPATKSRLTYTVVWEGIVTELIGHTVKLNGDFVGPRVDRVVSPSCTTAIDLLEDVQDPRRKAIEQAAREWWGARRGITFGTLVDRVIAALDEMESDG